MTDEQFVEEAERENRDLEAREHRGLFAAAKREQLIAEAATAILASEGIEPQEDGTYWGENTWPNAVKDAATALVVFEKATTPTTPTDDEREALVALIDIATDGTHPPGDVTIISGADAYYYADRILTAGFRRSEPSAADQGPAASCHLCVGAGGHEGFDGEWIECSCQRPPQGEPSVSPDDEGWARTVSDYRAVGWEGDDPGDHERMFWEAGFRQGVAALRAASELGGEGR